MSDKFLNGAKRGMLKAVQGVFKSNRSIAGKRKTIKIPCELEIGFIVKEYNEKDKSYTNVKLVEVSLVEIKKKKHS